MLRGVVAKRRKRRAQLQLRVIVEETIHLYPLPTTGRLSIGRAPECDVRIDDPTVSRHHAMLEMADGSACVCDTGSSYGLRVRNERVDPGRTIALAPGDAIEAGGAVLVIEPAAAPSSGRSRRRRRRAPARGEKAGSRRR